MWSSASPDHSGCRIRTRRAAPRRPASGEPRRATTGPGPSRPRGRGGWSRSSSAAAWTAGSGRARAACKSLGVGETVGGVDQGVAEEPVRSGGQAPPDGGQRLGTAASRECLGRGEPGPRVGRLTGAGPVPPPPRGRPAWPGPGRPRRPRPRPRRRGPTAAAAAQPGPGSPPTPRRPRPLPTVAGPCRIPPSRTIAAGAAAGQLAAGPLAHAGRGSASSAASRPAGRPAQSSAEPARVVGPAGPGPADPVDPAARLRLCECVRSGSAGRTRPRCRSPAGCRRRPPARRRDGSRGRRRSGSRSPRSGRSTRPGRGRGGRPAARCAEPRTGCPGTRRGRPSPR